MQASPISMSSSGSNDNTANKNVNEHIIANLGLDTTGKDGGGGGDGDGNGPNSNVDDSDEYNNIGKSGTRKNEFIFVNPRNIIINMFTGRNLHSNPYMPFNNSIRRLILAQGSDGEMLLKMLDKVETMGTDKYTNEQLREFISVYPKAAEFDIAIRSALLIWISGVANSVV